MLQNPRKTLGFKKNMVYKIPPGRGGKPYPASGLIIPVFVLPPAAVRVSSENRPSPRNPNRPKQWPETSLSSSASLRGLPPTCGDMCSSFVGKSPDKRAGGLLGLARSVEMPESSLVYRYLCSIKVTKSHTLTQFSKFSTKNLYCGYYWWNLSLL